jgi:phenylacetate-coenzyme A ligase PaaK-like adenylate-forming protein
VSEEFKKVSPHFIKDINATSFNDIALEVFRFQYRHNKLYQSYTDALHINPKTVRHIKDIPFLPISFFKTHKVLVGESLLCTLFESSGTTGAETSKHYVFGTNLYCESLLRGFRQF